MPTGSSLEQIASALRDAKQDIERAAWFVESHKFGGRGQAPETQLIRALADDPLARVAVEGPAGCGKTSLIVHALGKLPAFPHVSLVVRLRVGQSDLTADRLVATILDELAELIAHHGENNDLSTIGKNVDLAALAAASAQTTTTTQPGASTAAQGALQIPIVRAAITRTVYDATTSAQHTPTPSGRIKALREALEALAAESARLVVVIDDTEQFAVGNDPIEEPAGVAALYASVAGLVELSLQVVIAVHPRFREVGKASDVLTRNGFTPVPAPRLPPGEEKGLREILDRRLQLANLPESAADVFSERALAELKGLYHAHGRHDLRLVLRVAGDACLIAARSGHQTQSRTLVGTEHVNTALENQN